MKVFSVLHAVPDEIQEQYLTSRYIVVDVETDTSAPEGWQAGSYGLSVAADITMLSLYCPTADEKLIVLEMPVMYSSLKVTGEGGATIDHPHVDFIRRLLSRSDVSIIGHNVIFDLRQLGVHYEFELHPDAKVWDTAVMAVRLMIGEPKSHGGGTGLGLYNLATRYAWKDFFGSEDRRFYDIMKDKYRKDFSALVRDLMAISNIRESFWSQYLFDYGTEVMVGEPLATYYAKQIFYHYVAFDVHLTYELYKFERKVAEEVRTKPYEEPGKFKLMTWPKVFDLVNFEVRSSTVLANQAIRGVRFNHDYVYKQIGEYRAELAKSLQDIVDFGLNLSRFNDFMTMFIVLDNAFQAVSSSMAWQATSTTTKAAFSSLSKYPNLTEVQVSREFASQYFFGTNDDESMNAWIEWATHLNRDSTRRDAFSTMPTSKPPMARRLRYLIERQGYYDFSNIDDKLLSDYLYDVVAKFLEWYYSQAKAIPYEKLINSAAFKPYYLFVVCRVAFPSSDHIQYNPFLVTSSVKKRVESLTNQLIDGSEDDDDDGDDEVVNVLPAWDWVRVAIELRGFSFGKQAVDFYLEYNLPEDADVTHPLTPFRKSIQYLAWINRTHELIDHAKRTGRIHSLISRLTRTGRSSSSAPNMQNNAMQHMRGYFVADPPVVIDGSQVGRVLCEIDMANAENKTGAMVSGDNAFAMATEGGDFHSAQAKVYWPTLWTAYELGGNKAELKKLRRLGKAVTFGGAYGASAMKIGIMIKRSTEEARDILRLRDEAYPLLTAAKDRVKKQLVDNVMKGYYPSFVPLWSGARVQVTASNSPHEANQSSYKSWNYIQQGSVSEIIARATVDISDWLRKGGYGSVVRLNVHDSIILDLVASEADEVLPEIMRIIANQVPLEYRQRTTPEIHFVSELGPENAFKWGYNPLVEYPLSLEHFWNMWGVHKLDDAVLALPPEEREAPTWVVNVAAGETLVTSSPKPIEVIEDTRWADIVKTYQETVKAAHNHQRLLDDLSFINAIYTLRYKNKEGQDVVVPHLSFAAFMSAVEILVARGYQRSDLTDKPDFDTIKKQLEELGNANR